MERIFVDDASEAFRIKENLSNVIREWKSDEVFMKRVTSILIEEGRGLARAKDYKASVQWLQDQFPECQHFRITVHCHAGRTLEHEASPLVAFENGAHGVWTSWIPHAAQGGCNSSLVFLDHLLDNGNRYISNAYKMEYAVEVAKHLFYMNFNSLIIPQDCPIWGQRNHAQVHTAFGTIQGRGGDRWRIRSKDHYNRIQRTEDQKKFIREGVKAEAEKIKAEAEKMIAEDAADGQHSQTHHSYPVYFDFDHMEYRIAGLVSDNDTWWRRMTELGLTQGVEKEIIVPRVRRIAFELMNVNVRADFNSTDVLGELVRVAGMSRHDGAKASTKRNH